MMNNYYITNDDNTARYVLGKYINNPLIVFGINPSIATQEVNDNTISIIEKIAEMRNCDGYLMFNLYPLRATNIDSNFPIEANQEMHQENKKVIEKLIADNSQIVAAWGTHICDRKYFMDCLVEIDNIVKKHNAKWICLKKTKLGHPHHPTRLAYEEMTFEEFNIQEYIGLLR